MYAARRGRVVGYHDGGPTWTFVQLLRKPGPILGEHVFHVLRREHLMSRSRRRDSRKVAHESWCLSHCRHTLARRLFKVEVGPQSGAQKAQAQKLDLLVV